jgi:CBS domain-containing protein
MFRSILLDDFMARELVTTQPDVNVMTVVHRLVTHGYSGMPVVDAQGALVGMISEHDCLRAILSGTYQGDLGVILVGDVMQTQVDRIEIGASVVDAAARMIALGRRRLPVVDRNGALVGQVSRRDLLRAVAAYDAPPERV